MRFTFLGTGTSAGVPVLGCTCKVCRSTDPRDFRYRSAGLLETDTTRVLIDSGPDIRMQLMHRPFKKIDGVLLTHEHYDHTGGLDDLRPYCYAFGDLNIYANQQTVDTVYHNFPYCFTEHPYPGVPKFDMNVIEKHKSFTIGDIKVMPIEIMHDKLKILGYRFGTLAYITDMKAIADEELPYLEGVKTLVVNALRWEKPHHSHMLVSDAIAFSRRIGASKTYLIHVTHDIGLYDEANSRLPEGFLFPYDGMEITV
jgi:phosphoribosyl 1,2-cyclic phosphate phosphodiesterase